MDWTAYRAALLHYSSCFPFLLTSFDRVSTFQEVHAVLLHRKVAMLILECDALALVMVQFVMQFRPEEADRVSNFLLLAYRTRNFCAAIDLTQNKYK